MQTFITVIITAWLTMSILTIAKDLADRNSRGKAMLILIFIAAPIVMVCEIIGEWEEENRRWREFDKRWPKN